MQMVWLLLIIAVVSIFLIVLISQPQGTVENYDAGARQLVEQFAKTPYATEMIGFDRQVDPPVVNYTYHGIQKTKSVTLSNGTIVNQTETVYEKEEKPYTQLTLEVSDRMLKQPLICKQGQQCDITGTITLIDPITGRKIPAPVAYSMIIDCDFRTECTLSPSIGVSDATYPDDTFKYTWVVLYNINPGLYHATVFVTSKMTNDDYENERRVAVREIQVIP